MTEATAATEPTGAPQGESAQQVQAPQSAPQTPQSPAPDASPSKEREFEARPIDAVRRALKKFEQQEPGKEPVRADDGSQPPATEAKPPAEGERPRDEHGRFVKSEQVPDEGKAGEQKQRQEPNPAEAADAPQRFSADAKAEWAKTPAPVKAEVSRALKELETGIQQYQQYFEPLREYDRMARESGTNLHTALSTYVQAEQILRQDPIRGFFNIAQNMGLDFVALARHVVQHVDRQAQPPAQGTQPPAQGQNPPRPQPQMQRMAPPDPRVNQLNQEVAQLKQQIEQQQVSAIEAEIEKFAAAPGHERFSELLPEIQRMLETGFAKDLADAYAKADRLNPAQAPAAAAPAANPNPAPAQTRQPNLAVSGAPGSGSNPAHRSPPSSARDAVRRRMAALG